MSRAVMQQALEALEKCRDWPGAYDECSLALHDLRAALAEPENQSQSQIDTKVNPAEPEQEPVAWMYDFLNSSNREEVIRNWVTQNPDDIEREKGFNVRPLYTAPTPNTLEESNGKD